MGTVTAAATAEIRAKIEGEPAIILQAQAWVALP